MNTLKTERKKRAYKAFEILNNIYPDPHPLLNYKNPFELLIASILAAQCTDKRVNMVTPVLFKRFPDPDTMSQAPVSELEEIIKTTGFYRNKAKSIKMASLSIKENFKGVLPESIDNLVNIYGVGRKTANVVAGNCFNIPSVIVDTHFKRVSFRLDLSSNKDPDKIERDLREIIEEDIQTQFSLVINYHGRYRCNAKKPQCPECEIIPICPFQGKTV